MLSFAGHLIPSPVVGPEHHISLCSCYCRPEHTRRTTTLEDQVLTCFFLLVWEFIWGVISGNTNKGAEKRDRARKKEDNQVLKSRPSLWALRVQSY